MRRTIQTLLLLLPILFCLPGVEARAQSQGSDAIPDVSSEKVPDFPVPFGATNVGRDFWFSFPANWDIPTSSQYYIRLYITAGVETQVRVYVGGAFLKAITTKANDVVTVDFSPVQAQIFTRRDTDPIPVDQVYDNKAIHVEADDPIVVYGINRTSFTSDGMLVLPTNGLGREYVVASYGAVAGGDQELPSQYMIVSPYDNNTVSIQHVMKTPNHAEGERFTIQLDKGDVFSAMTVGYGGDVSGVTISASKPVFVAGGQNCTYIPNLITYCCCDHLVEQMLPVSSWGNFYHAIPFSTRRNGDFFRVFAAEPNTTIYINGAQYATLNQRGGEQGIGWIEYRAIGRDLTEFTADKPIYVAQYNTSQAYDGVPSDPFFLVLTPVEQYQTGITFATPADDYPQNYVSLALDSLAWDSLEIAVAGTGNWVKVFQTGWANPPKYFPSKVNGLVWMGVTLDIPPGTYRIRGPRPFAGYIYGFSAYDSYGYPLSVAVGDLQSKDTLPPDITKMQDCFGTVVAQTTDKPDDDKVRSNLSTLELDNNPLKSYNYRLTVTPKIEPGISIARNYRLEVIDQSLDAQAIYTISDAAGNTTTDTARYTAFNVMLAPTPLDLGLLIRGAKKQGSITITNRSAKPVTLQEARLQSGAVGFKLLSPTGQIVLGPAGSGTDTVTALIEFDATADGTYTDSLGLRDSCGLRYMARIDARVYSPIIKVSDWDFGQVVVGAQIINQIEVRNLSTAGPLTIYGGTGPGNLPLVFGTPDGLPLPTPFAVAPGANRIVRVSFQPPAIGPYTDTIFFSHNAPPSPENDSIGILRGEGIKAALYATPVPWGRKRITTRHTGISWLINTGSSQVTVTDIATGGITGDMADFGIEDVNDFRNRTVDAGDSIPVRVWFQPTVTGDRAMDIRYDVNPSQESQVISRLTGTGIQPALGTEDIDFGSMNIDERDENRTVRFWFVPTPYADDSVTINGFTFNSTQGTGGVADFRRVPLDQPVTLLPGDTVSFQGIFRAQAAGLRTATLEALTSDPIDVSLSKTVSNWQGIGILLSAALSGTGDSVRGVCVGSTADITATITNNGQAPLPIDNLRLAVGTGFQIINPIGALTLAPGETRQITVRFTPTTAGVQYDTIIVVNQTVPDYPILISGGALQEVVRGHLKMVGTTADNRGEIGGQIKAILVLDTISPSITIEDYTVRFTYNFRELQPVRDSIFPLEPVNATGATVAVTTVGPGQIDVAVDNSAPVSVLGDAVVVPLSILFDEATDRNVTAELMLPDGRCVTITIDPGTMPIAPICGLNLRMIEKTDVSYTLDQNKPNPFNPITVIRYSIGLDGPTKMLLFDTEGRVLQTLINEHQMPGVYELTVNVSNLPSGNYYYKLVSGDWTETRMLTVMK